MSACRCGTECVCIEHEGAQHELCPTCDALTIHAIKVGEVPQMILVSDGVDYLPTLPAPVEGRDFTRMQPSSGFSADSDPFTHHDPEEWDDDDDDDPDEWDDDDDQLFTVGDARELADEREARAWELFLCLIESTPRTAGKAPVIDSRALARCAFEASDAFAEVAEPEHLQHVRRTMREQRVK